MGNPKGVRRDFEALENRRLAAIKLFGEEFNNSEIGRRLKVCNQTVSRWRKQYEAGGKAALRKAGRAAASRGCGPPMCNAWRSCSSKVPSVWATRRRCGPAGEWPT